MIDDLLFIFFNHACFEEDLKFGDLSFAIIIQNLFRFLSNKTIAYIIVHDNINVDEFGFIRGSRCLQAETVIEVAVI